MIVPEINGALGNNGIYISDVSISWQNVIPATADPQTIVGCEEMTLTQARLRMGWRFPARAIRWVATPLSV